MILNDIVDETEYIFSIKREADKLHFILSENDSLCPYIFENKFSLEDFIKHHKAFKSCQNVDVIEHHFYKLYEKNKLMAFRLGPINQMQIQAIIGDISEETNSEVFDLYKSIKYNDEDVMVFYEIYKKDKLLKTKLKKIVIKGLEKENPLRKEILGLIKENPG